MSTKTEALKGHKAKNATKTPSKAGSKKAPAKAPAKTEAKPKKQTAPAEEPPTQPAQQEPVTTPESNVPLAFYAELNEDNLATAEAVASETEAAEDVRYIPFDQIRVRTVDENGKKFNKRKEGNFGDIEGLADSIGSVGLQHPIVVDALAGGEYLLNDGERRYRAIDLLRKQGATGFDTVKAIINPTNLSEAERRVIMVVSNNGKPFDPLEEAEILKEMRDVDGLEPIAIARATGNSIAYVEQRLKLADTTAEEKAFVKSGKVSATAAMELARKEKDPAKRVEKMKEATAGGGKLKVKQIKTDPALEKLDECIALIKQTQRDNEDEIVADSLKLVLAAAQETKKLLRK